MTTTLVDERYQPAPGAVIRIKIVAVPRSTRFPEGVKYAFHYGRTDSETTYLRYDNAYGNHEKHVGGHTEELESFPGVGELLRRFRAEVGGWRDPVSGRTSLKDMTETDTEPTTTGPPCRTLRVRIETVDAFFDRVEATVDEIEPGAAAEEPTSYGLSLPDESALARVFSVRNLELVRAIAEHAPSSMRALAKLVDRDIKNVSENLHELESLGLVQLVEDGRAKRPVVPYDAIEVVYPVRDRDDPAEDVPAE